MHEIQFSPFGSTKSSLMSIASILGFPLHYFSTWIIAAVVENDIIKTKSFKFRNFSPDKVLMNYQALI